MNIVAFGDTHLGPRDRRNDFGYDDSLQAYALREALAEWHHQGDILVAVGDIGDMWQASEDQIIEDNPKTVNALRMYVDYYVRGNHDRDATDNFLRQPPYPNVSLHGVFFEHGDAHDPVVARYPRLCRRVTKIVGRLERKWHPDVDRWAQSLWHWLTRTGRHGGNERYWTEVGFAAMERDCQIAVFGHSHQQSAWEGQMTGFGTSRMESGRMSGFSLTVPMHIYNTGHWTNGQRDVTRIEAK